MATPGIGDPYWFEWYVGLKNIINMLNPDNGIEYVIFQCSKYNTIDDVVVGYKDGGHEICYQIKHEIFTSKTQNLTFGKLLEQETKTKPCLLCAIAQGWQAARASAENQIKPILYTNRTLGPNRATRTFNGKSYSSYPIKKFFEKVKTALNKLPEGAEVSFEDKTLQTQWEEMCAAIDTLDTATIVAFSKAFEIQGNQLGLLDTEHELITSLAKTFACSDNLAKELFIKLAAALRKWTTTSRANEKIFIEDVYSILGAESEPDLSPHRLAPPFPFFESRKAFSARLEKQLRETNKKVVFISGNPGAGKTSIISHLQAEFNLFFLRYHTFRPISPEQHFYNTDGDLCTPENLWGTLLEQLRYHFRGKLAQYQIPLNNHFCTTEEMRAQVYRLLKILGREALDREEKIFVCIDGIDHAARAKNVVSFLDSLYLPEEIPDGICVIIVGQPADMYQSRYPTWITMPDLVEQINIPNINENDIKQLILARAPHFTDDVVGISNLVFQKTQGNNLSAVFAVEELKKLSSLEEVVSHFEKSHISADIQQYYHHMWNFVKHELSSAGLNILYPESVVSCPILLMNGRINTRILANALPYQISKTDWELIFNKLYPLIIPADAPDEFTLFHNDFRIFLMGQITGYQARYEEIAGFLADYLLHHNEGLLTYILTIPLLCHANKKELIPQYFTSSFVIDALAEGVSKKRLAEYAQLAYDMSCVSKDEKLYCNTYLAIKTLFICSHTKKVYDLPTDSNETEVKQITWLVRLASLLGKYHMRPTNMSSEALIRHVKWFLTTKLRRPFDYSKAHRFLLFILLKSNIGLKLLKTYDLAADLEYTLMNIDLLGMHYKVHILEFLKTHNRLPIIKKYIYALYGEDGTKIFLNENVVEMHQIFSPYGMLVAPDIMKAVSQKIKWNVVGYTGYKEYAMQGPSDCFELLTSMNPSLWKSYGHSLYWQSEYASLSNNGYSSDIQTNIAKAAAQCGLADFWELHFWNEDYQLRKYVSVFS